MCWRNESFTFRELRRKAEACGGRGALAVWSRNGRGVASVSRSLAGANPLLLQVPVRVLVRHLRSEMNGRRTLINFEGRE